ncbi:MAG: DNA-directed RNA polymerase subunit omega [Spirochaetales bacterium]|nr:DNA-directed RNA polymerase subunit omega [Spirochaetales bacterium]
MAKKVSSIPIGNLVSTDKNMYELTNAAIHRAKQISIAGSEDLESAGGKIVSLAIKEIVTEEVQYDLKQD